MAVLSTGLKKDIFIMRMLVSRDFKLKYRRSVLGVLWSVLNPLLMMIVISAVFSFIFRFQMDVPFAVYLIMGLTLFNLMANSTSAAVMSILGAAPLIKKIRVNKLIFPIEAVLFELVNYGLSLVAVVAVMIYFQVMPTLNLLFLPLLLLYVFLFCTGLSLLLSAMAVFFRDVIHLWGVVIIAWTYATPLFYPVTALDGWMQTVMMFNPMYHFVSYFRDIALNGVAPSYLQTHADLVVLFPGFLENMICIVVALLSLGIGVLVFRKTERKFILHV